MRERILEIDRVTHEPVLELTNVSELLESYVRQPGPKVHRSSIDTITGMRSIAGLPVERVRYTAERRIYLFIIFTILDQQIRLGAREFPSCDAYYDLSPALDINMLP